MFHRRALLRLFGAVPFVPAAAPAGTSIPPTADDGRGSVEAGWVGLVAALRALGPTAHAAVPPNQTDHFHASPQNFWITEDPACRLPVPVDGPLARCVAACAIDPVRCLPLAVTLMAREELGAGPTAATDPQPHRAWLRHQTPRFCWHAHAEPAPPEAILAMLAAAYAAIRESGTNSPAAVRSHVSTNPYHDTHAFAVWVLCRAGDPVGRSPRPADAL